jgi:prepilin-type cleavage/methylation N-terminal domain protein
MRQKGFTMIEILVVIVVFGVGILAILTMLTNSIGYFDTVNMQTRATMLAKEALDLVYNHRDGNLEQGYPRNYVGYDENNNKEIVRAP